MTPITFATPSPPRGRSPSFPTTLHVRSNIRSTSISMPSAISWNVASQNSSSSAASQPASKRPPEITVPSSLSQRSSYGCDKCPHHLEHAAAARGVRVTGKPRVDVGVGSEEAIDNRADLAIMVPLPMPEPVQGALLTGEGIEAEDARHRSQRGLLHPGQIPIAGQGKARKSVPP